MPNSKPSGEALYEALVDLENARLRARKIHEDSTNLLKGLELLIQSFDHENVLVKILDIIREVTHCENVFIMIYEKEQLFVKASTPSIFDGIAVKPGVFFKRILQGNISISFDVLSIPEWQPLLLKTKKIKSAIHIPLKFGENRSVLVCCDSRPHFFQNIHVNLIKNYATLATQTLINVNNIAIKKQAKRRLDLQFSIVLELSKSVVLSDVSKKMLQLICNHLEWEIGELWVIDDKKNKMILFDAWYTDPRLESFVESSRQFEFSPGEGLPGQIWENKQPAWIHNIADTNIFVESHDIQRMGLHSFACFPIQFDDKIYGIIEFFSLREQLPDIEEIKMFSTLGNQIGVFFQRLSAQDKITELNKELILTARQAGMAEVAASVLHNIGNVLNSVNVSTDVLREMAVDFNHIELAPLIQLLEEHREQLGTFFIDHPKGKYIFQYLTQLSEIMKKYQTRLFNETDILKRSVEHIMKVIFLQQSMAKATNITEQVPLFKLLNDTLIIHRNLIEKLKINVQLNCDKKATVTLDKIKTEQILINLVRNAIDSLVNCRNQEHQMILSAAKDKNCNMIVIAVTDNGEGITQENLQRIFNFGFTTKSQGHGFGLHISALAAKDMGGSLEVTSAGPGEGATFTLTLPIIAS